MRYMHVSIENLFMGTIISTPKISLYTLHKCIFLSNYRKFGVPNEIFGVLITIFYIYIHFILVWNSISLFFFLYQVGSITDCDHVQLVVDYF